jgi:protein arginine kinase activator
MKCQRCKEREANVQIMQQIAGKKPQTFMLCDVCARELGISMPTFPMTGKVSSNPFAVMGNIFQSNFGLGADEIDVRPASRCSKCKMTFEEFKRTGYLGCPSCYEAFASQMDPVFTRTQMGKKHIGRKPGSKSGKGTADDTTSDAACDIDIDDVGSTDRETAEAAEPVDIKDNADTAKRKRPAAKKPDKKAKMSGRDITKTQADDESEELAALEKQHMDRLLEEKRAELAAAVAVEDYIKAARIRDEIAALNSKKEG